MNEIILTEEQKEIVIRLAEVINEMTEIIKQTIDKIIQVARKIREIYELYINAITRKSRSLIKKIGNINRISNYHKTVIYHCRNNC